MESLSDDFNLHFAVMQRQDHLKGYLEDWASMPHWTHSIDRAEVETAVSAVYALEELKPPAVIFCESLWQMAALAISWSSTGDFMIVDECSRLLGDERKRELWGKLKHVIKKQSLDQRLREVAKNSTRTSRTNLAALLPHRPTGETIPGPPPKLFDLSRQLESKFKLRTTELFGTIRREAVPAQMLGALARISAAYNSQLIGEPQEFVFLHQDLVQDKVVADVWHDLMHLEARKISDPVHQVLREKSINLDDWFVLLPDHRQFLLEMGYTVRELARTISAGLFPEGSHKEAADVEQVEQSLLSTLSVEVDYKFWFSPWAVHQLPPYFYLVDCFDRPILPEAMCHELKVWKSLARSAFSFLFFPDICLVCERPRLLSMDERGRLHNVSGPSLLFTDGYSQYFWQGRAVTKQIVETPETITVEQIEKESNAEIKRILIERYGLSRFIMNSHAEKIQEDETGVLYRKEMVNDEPLVVVMVANSTAEPDGTFKNYFLRVPPRMMTAKEAVAWTFGMHPLDYDPNKET